MTDVSLQNSTTLLSGRHAGFDWFRSAPCPDLLHSRSCYQFGRDLGDQESTSYVPVLLCQRNWVVREVCSPRVWG